MPKSCRPLLLARASRRVVGRPMMRKSFGILQRHLLGHRQGHGGLGQFAVAQLAATGSSTVELR